MSILQNNVKLLLFENKTPKVYSSNRDCSYWDCIFVRFMLISFHLISIRRLSRFCGMLGLKASQVLIAKMLGAEILL